MLENISKSGAKLAITGAPAIGTEVVLQWHEHDAFGTVRWASATHCGVLFESAVPPNVLQATLSLDEVARVPEESNLASAARAWFDGRVRFGFD